MYLRLELLGLYLELGRQDQDDAAEIPTDTQYPMTVAVDDSDIDEPIGFRTPSWEEAE